MFHLDSCTLPSSSKNIERFEKKKMFTLTIADDESSYLNVCFSPEKRKSLFNSIEEQQISNSVMELNNFILRDKIS